MSKKLRFEELADIDVDSAVFKVGLQHYPIGPARPAILIRTGALDVSFNVHFGDIDTVIWALEVAKEKLKAAGWPK